MTKTFIIFLKNLFLISSLKWLGQLTEYQERVSKGLLEEASNRDTLVHAVTGEKRKMIKWVAQVLDQGGAVLC